MMLIDLPECFVSHVGIQMLHVVYRAHKSADIEAGLGRKRVPNNRGRVEHERLQE